MAERRDECPDMADSGLEDDLVSSNGDLRSVSDFDLEDVGQCQLEVPSAVPTVSTHLRQFLKAMKSPKMRRKSEKCEPRSPPETLVECDGDLEYDWWEGQFSFHGNGFGESDICSWYLDTVGKVQALERQVTVLAENQNNNDDRYTRSKEENASLQARLIMLEEQLREVEMRAEEQLDAERRRHREIMQRVEREKTLEVENMQIRLQGMEKELRFAESEAARFRQQLETVRLENSTLEERLTDTQYRLSAAQEEATKAVELERRGRQEMEQERTVQSQLAEELSRQLEETRREASLRLKSETDESGQMRQRHSELETELRSLRQEKKALEESNEELQAQLLSTGLQEGRQLLDSGAKSLAAELEDMSGDQVDGDETAQKLKNSLREQQEVNRQLRTYIDGILLNIVENYPQLLEVKRQNQ